MKTVRSGGLLLLAFVAGCGGGGGGGGQCLGAGIACSIPGQCCSKTCTNGQCVGGGMGNGDMAMQGGNPDMTMGQNCQPVGGNCSKPADCCNGVACTNGKCMDAQQQKKFGETGCTANGDCSNNLCIQFEQNTPSSNFCSANCGRTADCTALNPSYGCVMGTNVTFCLRVCSQTSDCASFGIDWNCRQAKTLENVYRNFCGVFQDQGAGYACLDNAQCAKGACNGAWCVDPCIRDADCGQYAKCVNAGNNVCFPNCTVDSDCLFFGQGNKLTCKSATSQDGVMVKVCSF